MAKMTDTAVKNLKAQDKPFTVTDGQGLSLLVKPDSSKLWEFRFTSPTLLKRRKTSLGKYPDVSLKAARDKARDYRVLISDGIDPIDLNQNIKKQKKIDHAGLFEKVVDEWFERQKTELAASTYKKKVAQFDNDIKPFFTGRHIASIKHPEIVKALELKAIKGLESSHRMFAYLNNLWQYATMKGYCDFNIMANIHKRSILTPHKKKHYAKITDPQILKELTRAIYSYRGDYSTRNALKFVLHLPLRAENLVSLKWEYIDFDNNLLTIPRHLMKAKDKNMDDFIMPLTPQVIEILNEQKLFTSGTSYIFKTSGYADVPISSETPNMALKRMGFNDEGLGRKIRLHGFRGTFRSLADTHQAKHNTSHQAKERALDHLPKDVVERAYTHRADYISELRTLMMWWSGYLDEVKR